jgi:hypothetical protein
MKKIITLLLLPLLVFLLISCNKNNEEDKNGKLVKTVELEVFKNEEVVQIVSYTYFYDNQNRVIKIKELYRENYDPFYYESTHNFIYSPSTIIENDKYHHQLDDNGYLIRTSENYNGTIYYTSYIYENGYLKEAKNSHGDSVKYTWLNGNMVQAIGYFYRPFPDDTLFIYTTNYEYTTNENLLNINLPWDSGYDFLGARLKFKGAANKNLLKKFPDSEEVINYNFDENGYPIQIMFNLYSPYPIIQEKQKYTITYY